MKQSGLGDNFYVGGSDLSGDVGAVQTISNPIALLDVTGINKSAHERLPGLRGGEISFTTFFNDAALAEHAELKLLPTADTLVTYYRGTALGGNAACLTGKQVNYDWVRGADGSLMGTIQALSNAYGLEWGLSLTEGKRTDTAATAPSTGVDFTDVSTAFGMAAYLHIFSFTGTSVTMRIQDSADNSTFANITGLAAFTTATASTFERQETDTLARTIRRYLKVNTTGTFSECTFAVVAVRYFAANRAGK